MEGGVGILLLLIILVIGIVLAIAMYLTSGAIVFGKDREKREVADRPEHEKVTARHLEHTDFGKREE